MDLLESVEFGDWLIHEIAQEKSQARHAGDAAWLAAQQARITALENAKTILLEFLVLQESMLKAAARRRA